MATVRTSIQLYNGMTKALDMIAPLMGVSDALASTTAKLNMMNDRFQTTEELQQKIFQSAQRARADFLTTANVVAGLGTGEVFANNDETIAFAENLNKMFVIAGATQQEVASTSMQLTQALGDGVLRGEELNAVFKVAPNIVQIIADYLQVPIDNISELASEGLITADIVKNAMLSATEQINEQFESMPMTWEQVWTSIVNRAIMYSQPLLNFINLLANIWAILEPIVLGLAGAMIVYTLATHGAEMATNALAVAQAILSAIMGLNPFAKVVLGIIFLITVIYSVIAAINMFQGTSISATEVIVGALSAGLAFVGNLLVMGMNLVIDIMATIWNIIATVAEFIANVFVDPVGAVVGLFSGLGDNVLGILEGIASSIDTIFGSNLAKTVNKWRGKLQKSTHDLVGEPIITVPQINASEHRIDRFVYKDAYKDGANWARDNIKLGSSFGGIGGGGIDYIAAPAQGDIGSIADSTRGIKDSLEITEEDLKYLRDLAEREVIDRTVLRDVKLEVSNTFGDVRETADVDGIISTIEERLEEAVAGGMEGVYNV